MEHIELFQNGIKEEGMAEVIKSLGANKNLKVMKINDNLVKNASQNLIEILPNLAHLETIDISDSLLILNRKGIKQNILMIKEYCYGWCEKGCWNCKKNDRGFW